MEEKYYRTSCLVDYGVIRQNFVNLKALLPENVMALAVIKANAYGHGAVYAAKALEDVADYFGVATIDEALEIRGISSKKILVLGYVAHSDYPAVVRHDIIPAIYSHADALALDKAAAEEGKAATVHLAVDTGMSRIGFQCTAEDAKEAKKIFSLKNIYVEGAFSHFSKADETDKSFTKKQAAAFDSFFEMLGEEIKVKHLANSAGTIDFDEYRYDMCREGISMYGYMPSDEVDKSRVSLKPALEWHSHVTHVKYLEPGRIISYGGTFTVKEKMKVATVSIGYADGYPRLLSNKGRVIINGEYAPILGRVCMDQMMVDVSSIEDVKPEDDVILLGTSGDKKIDADDIAGLTNTISYEVLCDIGERVPRIKK